MNRRKLEGPFDRLRVGNANSFLDRELQPLGLSDDEKQALLTFLRSLTGDIYEGPDAVVDVK